MTLVLLCLRLVLAIVFAAAAVGKLAGLAGTRATLASFGVPARLRRGGALALPLLELVVAVLLVPAPTARAGAILAAALLLVFCAALARVLGRGEQPECNCFGQLGSAPVSRATLARNGILLGMSVAVLAAGPGKGLESALAGVDPALAAGVIALVLVLGLQAWFSFQLLRQNGRLLDRVRALEDAVAHGRPSPSNGLPVGVRAPAFSLADLRGGRRTLAELLEPGLPLALVFADPDCGACAPMLPWLDDLAAERSGELTIALITRGALADAREGIDGYQLEAMLVREGREVIEAYGVSGVPSALVIEPDGMIATPTVVGLEAIKRLLVSPSETTLHPIAVPA